MIYEIKCLKHNENYIGETSRALKRRGYEHRVVSHEDSKKSHSIKTKNSGPTNISSPTPTRRSNRNTPKKNYKDLHTGRNIELTEGATEVSKHKAEYNHIEGDFEMKAISYDKNFYTRGIREAIEIRKKNPSLNSDNGRYFLPKIYDLVLSRDRNPSQDNGTV